MNYNCEEDDDDDDEEPTAVEPVAPAQPIAPAIPAAVEADLNAAAQESEHAAEAAAEATDAESEPTGAEDEEGNAIAEGQAASAAHETALEGAESVSNPVHVPAISTNEADAEDEDDDDDDDEDDVDLVYTEDEDEDDEDEDDEDDDDVDSITDIAGARQARGMQSDPSSDVSAIYVAKYNRFVDNILGRINKILRSNYDPVTVKLTNPNAKSKTNKQKGKNKSKKNSGKSETKKNNLELAAVPTEKISVEVLPENTQKTLENAENITASVNTIEKEAATTTMSEIANRAIMESITKSTHRRTSTGNKKNKNRVSTKNKTKNQATNNKTKATKARPKARATLYGLASLQRSGDVSVNMMSDHTMIKTKFTLGPLVLKVEKEFGRTAKKELRSATATTAEMSGKLSLRVLHGGVATLNSIRVLQPKQVRVESKDDHDRTREFVWKRSSHIAHLVSEKLSLATKSMLRPPPATVTSA
ncbi:uncharacterized protein LOC100877435 isoform X3 [Megachile rotundata]|uniref:uncharacterized protein LOC100877435 isoform X3 n=1 Tax=Megachile rotundata TaxID=143995 RepID=UPI003FD0FEC1